MRGTDERGAVLVEFALVALVLSMLLAVTVDFGRLLFSAQALQDVARVAARELSVTPLDASLTFDQALDDPRVLSRIYDRAKLVVNLDDPAFDTDIELDAYFASNDMPIVNRALRPLMIVDARTADHPRLLRYPGALAVDPAAPSGFTVGIPQILDRDAVGVETIQWVRVIEEIRIDPCDGTSGPFSITSPGLERGIVALRLNYPYQAAALTGFRPNPAGPFEPNIETPNLAADALVAEVPPPPVCPPRQPPGVLGANDPSAVGALAGPYGLGRQLAFAQTVRPFRRLLAAQAIYRREVFE